jgi:catechol 2,3-dioxygenase-like lactoylglutathione lyase family enzyme
MIRGVKFVGIPVARQDEALRFYTEKLGFVVVTDQPYDDRQRWIELGIPGAETRVVLFLPEGHEDRVGGFSHVTFASDDVTKTFRELSARGVEFTGEPESAPWGSYAVFKDLDGNEFVLSRSQT